MKTLTLKDVVVRFGEVRALDGVSVSVHSGETVMLVGPNGAGKSTLLRVLLSLVRAQRGELLVDDKPLKVGIRGGLHAFRRQLGYLPEAVAFSENLSGRNVLKFFAMARGVPKGRINAVLKRVGLEHAARRAVRGYSRGMRQRLGLGVAILADPHLLVLDEPTGGLDQEGLEVLWGVLAEWREMGRIALISSHDLTLLERRVDRIGVLKHGRLVAMGSPADLRERVGLPVRVTFGVGSGGNGLASALADWQVVERDDRRLVVEAPPDRLLDLVRFSVAHERVVTSMRVEEPGLDQVYDRLLGEEAP